VSKDSDFGLHIVVIDELALYLRGGTKSQRDRFAELLRDLIARGRAAGIIVVAATQKPSHDVVPTSIRDLFSYRLAMRCSSSDASDTILGQGWASRDYSAASIAPANRGVGYLLAEGGVPVLIKTPHLSDAEIAVVARRAASGRSL
jgi:S-DNA-T family DNA segregation ATPase FtsK/SpoIIIE